MFPAQRRPLLPGLPRGETGSLTKRKNTPMKRTLISAFALLAALGAARIAEEKTSSSITSSGSKTITDSADGSWTEDTKWGEFGAGYSAGYTIYSNYSGSDKYEKVQG